MTHLFYWLVVPALFLNLVCACLWCLRKGFQTSVMRVLAAIKEITKVKLDDWAKPVAASIWVCHHTALLWHFFNKPGVCWDILAFSLLADAFLMYLLYSKKGRHCALMLEKATQRSSVD